MDAKNETGALGEKRVNDGSSYADPEAHETVAIGQSNILHRDLKGRHMQMIAMYVGPRVLKCIPTDRRS